jgi:hypothetical protein
MKIQVVYCYPAHSGDGYVDFAWRYLNSCLSCPAGIDHENIIVCNGGITDAVPEVLKALPNCRLMIHDNSGYDIGAFQAAARASAADLMVFMGVSAWVKGEGWLARIAESFKAHGEALYGVMGNSGVPQMSVWPHIRTTGFWMSPALLNRYPHIVSKPDERYAFEHGPNCLTQWVRNQGLKALVVSWGGVYDYSNWDTIPNGFHRGDQSAMLIGDRLSDPPYHPVNAMREVPRTGGNRM